MISFNGNNLWKQYKLLYMAYIIINNRENDY